MSVVEQAVQHPDQTDVRKARRAHPKAVNKVPTKGSMTPSLNLPSGSASIRPEPVGPPVLPGADVHMRDMIAVLRRELKVIGICVVTGVVLAMLANLLMHKKYSGVSLIEITKSSGDQPLGLGDLSGIGAELTVGEQMTSDLLTQSSIISSDSIALAVINNLHLADKAPFAIPSGTPADTALGREQGRPLDQAPHHTDRALAIFRSNLLVEVLKGTRLMTVTYTDRDPEQAVAIANAVVDASIGQYADARSTASSRASASLTAQVRRLEDNAAASQRRVVEFQQQNGVSGMATSSPGRSPDGSGGSATFSNVPLDRLLELNRELTAAEVIRNEKQAIYEMTKTQDPDLVLGIGASNLAESGDHQSVLSPRSADLVLLQTLRQQLAQAEVKLTTLAGKYGSKNPAITELEIEKKSIQGQIGAELRRLEGRALNDLRLATQTEQGLKAQVDNQQMIVAKTGVVADELVMLQQQALADRTLFQDLHTKLEEATVVAKLRSSNISIIDVARVPSSPTSPLVWRNLGLGLLVGLVLGLIVAFTKGLLSDSLYEPKDLQSLTQYPVLAVTPLSAKLRRQPRITVEPQSASAEAYRSFRTGLLQLHGSHPNRTTLFVSPSPGDGRSTACLNAATAFAVQGHRTLILDADMRPSENGKLYGADVKRGLSSCLNGSATPDQVIQPLTFSPNLFLLPSGPDPENPSELLGNTAFTDLLGDLVNKFDYIFIDSPPAQANTDARVLSQLVDVVIVVVRSGETSKESVEDVLSWVPELRQAAIGICLNGVKV